MRCVCLALAGVLVLSTSVFAADPAPAAAPTDAASAAAPAAKADDKAKEEPKICFDERDTGSRVSKRVCMTRKEYRQRQLES